MTNFHDNPFETDGSMHNIRVHAEHDDQLSVARVLQSAVARRAGLLDSQHRLSPAGRLDAADQRLGGRAVLQQHDPVGDRRRPRVEHALAQQPDPRRELGAGDLQRHHVHQLHLVRLQRLPARIPGADVVVPVELAAARRARRLHRRRATRAELETREFATLADYSAGHRAGSPQRARRLRHLRERAAARRAGRRRRCRSSTRPRTSTSG